MAVFEGKQSSNDIIINDTICDDEVVVSDVPPRYLLCHTHSGYQMGVYLFLEICEVFLLALFGFALSFLLSFVLQVFPLSRCQRRFRFTWSLKRVIEKKMTKKET